MSKLISRREFLRGAVAASAGAAAFGLLHVPAFAESADKYTPGTYSDTEESGYSTITVTMTFSADAVKYEYGARVPAWKQFVQIKVCIAHRPLRGQFFYYCRDTLLPVRIIVSETTQPSFSPSSPHALCVSPRAERSRST